MDQTVLNKSDMFISRGKVLQSSALNSSQFQWNKEDAELQRCARLGQLGIRLSETICVQQSRLPLYKYKAADRPDKGCFIMVWGLTQTGTTAGISVQLGFCISKFPVCSWSMAPLCSFSSQFQVSPCDQVKKSLVQSPMTEFTFVIRCALIGDNVVLYPGSFLWGKNRKGKRLTA